MRRPHRFQTADRSGLVVIFSIALWVLGGHAAPARCDEVPGVVIDHLPASSRLFIGSPSIAILPDGSFVAAHDVFGPASGEFKTGATDVFASADDGRTWRKISRVEGAFWSNLFVHRGALYLMGPMRHHGPLVIRRSTDGGHTWTTPADETSGLLAEGEYHTAPMPMVVHDGRLWRAIEDAAGGGGWPQRYRPLMASAPTDSDLLERRSWTFSNTVSGDVKWLDGAFKGWLEGNAVVGPDGGVVDILRVEAGRLEKAAMVRISADGRRASFDPATGFLDLPGGAAKFAIRRDPASEHEQASPVWWMLSNAIPASVAGTVTSGIVRNSLVLLRSTDLRSWERRAVVLHHPDRVRHGFQYVDWLFDGEDLVVVSRTAFDDASGGAKNFHDANYLTFHRVRDFRSFALPEPAVGQRTPAP